jgi:ribose transport system permease protein
MSDTTAPAAEARGGRLRIPMGLRANWLPVAALIVLAAITAIIWPQFFHTDNLWNVARQSSIVGVLAVGMTFVILTGGIDLSVGSILAIAAVVMASLLNEGTPLILTLVIVIALSAAIGMINGLGIALLNIQPFIMTLATMVIGSGVALRITNGGPREFFLESNLLEFLGSGGIGRVPGPLIVFLGLALIGWAVLRYVPFGRFLYAIGGSAEAARLSGVRVNVNLVGAYAVSGACAGIAGIMTAARLSVGDPTAGNLSELDAIAAVVIGGTSLMGGVGGMPGTVFGALLLAVVANVMNIAGVSPFDQQIVKGLVILIAVLLAAFALKKRLRPGATGQGGDDDNDRQKPEPAATNA